MKIGVCMKSVPDSTTRIRIVDGTGIDESGIKWTISEYDTFGLEEAVQAKEKLGGEVVLFTVGPDRAEKNLRDALALGADRAVHVRDAGLHEADSLSTARALAAAIKAEGCDIVFTGNKAIDYDNVQVPAMVAELLDWPHVSFVADFSIEGTTWTATRAVGGGTLEVCRGELPVVITADKGMNERRYAKLPDIMKAKRKPVATMTAAELGLSADDIAPGVLISDFAPPPPRPSGRVLTGDRADVVRELVQLLRNEAKVI